MRLHLSCLISAAIICFTSCGARLDQAKVAVAITPATASISTGSSVQLSGGATGFTIAPLVGWYMQEGVTAQGCGFDTTASVSSTTDCPAGYVTYNRKATGVPSVAMYHAPETPGTYHPTFFAGEWDASNLELVSKTTTAEITVTP